jgi:hypothetical protein
LDYTNNFSGNKSPDSFLYNFLTDLYGSVDGSRAPNVTLTNGGNNATANQSPGSRRKTRSSRSSSKLFADKHKRKLFSSVTDERRRQELLERWNEINALVINGFDLTGQEGWKLLHRTKHGEAHEIHLDDEHKVQIHLLLA